ncbi:hypothetical protein BLOT_006307 [Blomia tropicalis]|nr:hypothetical protein BLOT_006307 [Blomia tropicalis]
MFEANEKIAQTLINIIWVSRVCLSISNPQTTIVHFGIYLTFTSAVATNCGIQAQTFALLFDYNRIVPHMENLIKETVKKKRKWFGFNYGWACVLC